MSIKLDKEVEDILKTFWESSITKVKSRPRKDFYTQDFILGFNTSIHKMFALRVINKTILVNFLSNFDN